MASPPTASFNAYDLATYVPGLRVIGIPFRSPNRELQLDPVARADLSKLSSVFTQSRKMVVIVEIGRDSRELLDQSIAILEAILQGKEKTLLLSFGTTSRKWTATYDNMSFEDPVGGLMERIEIEFSLADPFGYDTSTTTIFSETLTGSSKTHSFNLIGVLDGAAEWQVPIITVEFTALSGADNKNVVIGNPATGQSLTLTKNWVANDDIEINCKEKTVKVNGSDFDFDGAIPEWGPGAQGLDYSDTMSTRTRQIIASYVKRYAY